MLWRRFCIEVLLLKSSRFIHRKSCTRKLPSFSTRLERCRWMAIKVKEVLFRKSLIIVIICEKVIPLVFIQMVASVSYYNATSIWGHRVVYLWKSFLLVLTKKIICHSFDKFYLWLFSNKQSLCTGYKSASKIFKLLQIRLSRFNIGCTF